MSFRLCESRRPEQESEDVRADYASEAARVGERRHERQLMRVKAARVGDRRHARQLMRVKAMRASICE